MRLRAAVTVTLLVFVLLTAATIVVKDTRRSRQAKAFSTQVQQAAAVAPNAKGPAAAGQGAPTASPAAGFAAAALAPVSTAPVATPHNQARSLASAARPATPRRVVHVTYFYTTTRCVSCYKIEALSEAAVSATFAGALAQGDLVWRAINIDEPGNEHYIDDYKLFTKSLIVSEVVGDKEVRFKNLDRVWKLLGDEQAFSRYVIEEVGGFAGHS